MSRFWRHFITNGATPEKVSYDYPCPDGDSAVIACYEVGHDQPEYEERLLPDQPDGPRERSAG